jgi:type II restriction enzyme
MKFDFAIGNPPYQEMVEGTSDKPIYNEFMEAAYSVAEKVELITPARFLFNAGKTPKAWNEKMLSDTHLKVSYYEQDSSKIFANTDIKGGVAVTYRDASKDCGAIGVFTTFEELNSILNKVKPFINKPLSDWVYAPESYKFTDLMHKEHPEVKALLSTGHAYDVTSNIFDKLENIVFFLEKPKDGNDYVQLVGRKANDRVLMWVQKRYIKGAPNFNEYKVFVPKSNGSGAIGETLSTPLIGQPLIGHTQTFISIGRLGTEKEAENLMKYIKTKFMRTMLGVLKVTQDNKKAVWRYIPVQDFTSNSDIDWSQSVAGIDRQLYKKYNFSPEEINFIETHVKEMV